MSNPLSPCEVFWGEISPCDHIVQIYEEDRMLLDALAGFIGRGLGTGDAAVVIATPSHLDGLGNRLRSQGLDLDTACCCDQYIALDAEHTLSRFMRDGWPDEQLFKECVRDILHRPRLQFVQEMLKSVENM